MASSTAIEFNWGEFAEPTELESEAVADQTTSDTYTYGGNEAYYIIDATISYVPAITYIDTDGETVDLTDGTDYTVTLGYNSSTDTEASDLDFETVSYMNATGWYQVEVTLTNDGYIFSDASYTYDL